jgi:hypothetical protein
MSAERAVTNGSHHQPGKPKHPNETRSSLYAMFWTQRKVWFEDEGEVWENHGPTSEPYASVRRSDVRQRMCYDFRR